MKILIIRLSAIGDIVLTTPVFRLLKNAYPQSEVHFLTKVENKEILLSNIYIDKFIVFDKNFWQTFQSLKKENYDKVIDLHCNWRSWAWTSILFKPTIRVEKLSLTKRLMSLKWIKIKPLTHFTQRCIQALEKLGIKDDNQGLDFFIDSQVQVDVQLPNKYVAIALGATFQTKALPLEQWIKICNNITLPVVLLGGKQENEKAEKIVRNATNNVINCCGKFSIQQSAWVIQKCTKLISHDTGLMHIAAALRKPIISIWGSTISQFGMYPYFEHSQSKMFEVQNLSCRPCSHLGYNTCPKQHFKCMKCQDTEAIAYEVNKT